MLDRLCVSRHRHLDPLNPLDLGALGEAMLYYGEVRLVATRAVMTQLVRELAPDELLAALAEGYLRLTYMDGGFGVLTENTGTTFELHKPTSYQLETMSFDTVVDQGYGERFGSSKARNMRRRLSPYIDLHVWDDAVRTGAVADFRQSDYVTSAARAIVIAAGPDVPGLEQSTFDLQEKGEQFSVETDVDFNAVNRSFHQRIPQEIATITPSFILSELVEGWAQLQFAAEYEGELVTDPLTSQVLQLRCEDVIFRSSASSEKVHLFQERVLTGRSVRESINRGDRSFSDLLSAIASARRFRAWVDSKPDDRDLLDAYYEEISKDSWVGKLPARTVRWAICGAAGLIMPALGVPIDASIVASLGLSGLDELLLERLGRGWRPNQFVDGTLTRFVKDRG